MKILGALIAILILAGLAVAYQIRLFNRPPKADFEISLKYINPTDETLIEFINKSTDPDGDKLIFSWFVDGRSVNTSRDYWAKLPSGNSTVKLMVSDGKHESSIERIISVEKSRAYPISKLGIPFKGIVYDAGIKWKDGISNRVARRLTPERAEEEVGLIKDELGCNAIRIEGDDDFLFVVAEMAIQKGFKKIAICPRYIDQTMDDTKKMVIAAATKAENLRQRFPGILFIVGNELSVDCRGVLSNASTYDERTKETAEKNLRSNPEYMVRLNIFLKELVTAVTNVFKGEITYASMIYEKGIKWNELGIEISFNQYYHPKYNNEKHILEAIKEAKKTGKKVYITEFGSATFTGAFEIGGAGYYPEIYQNRKYDQDEQANSIKLYVDLFDAAGADGIFLCKLIGVWEDDRGSFGVLRFYRNKNPTRKLGFYMYKSYVLDKSPQNPASESSLSFSATYICLSSSPSVCLTVQVAPNIAAPRKIPKVRS